MMMMVQETLSTAQNRSLQLHEAKMIKFLGVVNPNVDANLTIACEVAEGGEKEYYGVQEYLAC